ncbi:hypothetical protein F5Y11DRAFT_273073 [Daldinia sp. FL1419]|nr:hypothetical protein F5Y11DRAFT_273073 [Daldinia sp. FL1419]
MTALMAADRPYSPGLGDSSNPPEKKQSSGFTPLPPIRRTSTFDLLSRKKLSGEEDDETPSPVGSSDNEIPPVPPMKDSVVYQNGNGHIPDRGQVGQAIGQLSQHQNFSQPPHQHHPSLSNGFGPAPNGFSAGRGIGQPNGFQQQGFMGGPGGPGGPHQSNRMPGQPGALPTNPGYPFASQMEGNPIQKFPPGGQWKLEESRLTEPLIQHKTRPGANSPSQPAGYYGYDKETEDASPPVRKPGPSQRPRNNSNSIPPVSAERYRPHNIFAPHPPQQSQPLSPPQAGQPLPSQNSDNATQEGRNSHDTGLNKEPDVHVDEVSVSSTTSEGQDSTRRGSGFFSLARRTTGAEQEQQNPNHNGSTKDKAASFFGVANHTKYQPAIKSNLGSTFDHDDNPEPASMRKRLSELTGMIKGVGNAKDGAKDDQPAKVNTPYVSRPSMQGSMQGPMRTQAGPQQFQGQGGLYAAPSGVMGRNSPSGPRPPEAQRAQGDEDREKKHGFLGGLFNRQGKSSETKSESKQPSHQMSPPQRPPQQQFLVQPGQQPFRPGQMPPPGQQFSPHPMYPGHPPMQPGLPGQQGARRPMGPGQNQPNSTDIIQSPTSPQVLEVAQLIQMRRPSEITVSQNPVSGSPLSPNQRPPMSQQGSQIGARPGTGQDNGGRNIPRQPGVEDPFSMSSPISKDFHDLSRANSFDMPNVGGSSLATRTTPTRKPVASSLSKQDGVSVTSTSTTQNSIQQSPPNPTRIDDSTSQSESPDDEQRLSNHLPSGQQSPTLGKLGHVRQTSLPSPGRPPVLTHPGQVTPSSIGSAQFFPHGAKPSQDRQVPGQPHGSSQGQSPASSNSPHDLRQNTPWSANVTFVDQPRAGYLPRLLASTPDQSSTLTKFFGVDFDGESINSAKPIKESKEKSAAARFMKAFKRDSKRTESHNPSPAGGRHTPPGPGFGQQATTRQPTSGPPHGPPSQVTNQPMPPQGIPGAIRPQPPPMMHGAGRGQEPRYDQVPIPQGYEAVHGYGQPGMMAPSPYNIGRPSPPPANHQFQPLAPLGVPPGVPRNWDPRNGPIPQGIPYGPLPPQMQPSHQGLLPQLSQRQADSQSTTPTPSDQGTFLDTTPTPPPQKPREDSGYNPQLTQGVLPQHSGAPSFQQPQIRLQSNLQQVQNPETQTPSSSNWGSAPDSAQTAHSPKKSGPPILNGSLHSKPSDPNVSPPSDNDDTQRSPHRHIATAMIKGTQLHPPVLQQGAPQNGVPPNAARSFSTPAVPTRVPGFPAQSQIHNQSPPSIQESLNQPTPNGAGHLVSKMSTTNLNDVPKPTSLSPDINAIRAASVSPEPPAPERPSPYHQVSNNSLNINVDRANDPKENGGGEDDIYDATPRLNHTTQSQGQTRTPAQEPANVYETTKYAGSEKSRTDLVNGGIAAAAATGVAAGAVGVAVSADASSIQESAPEDPSPPQRLIAMNIPAEPEEKIAVDHPVELPAVNVDDDDGIPVMSATSYPGQEWNPYEAGEFGDFDM